ncbi:MAG TPA: prolipoprotein diacylglyceryl transferase family protein, partial [Gaiellaceae bacterium]|nr:prolipoprotein diacylglyceryl transferase family protein [Gaiellaceae bacterium]
YGKPTSRPWGLKIDFSHRVSGYESSDTFQPTFLYEFVYDLFGVGLLLLLAQGIGRWGNWFNQELYGKPTGQPWGLKIDFSHRVAGYEGSETFQPTFLYEFVYDMAGVVLLLVLDRRFRFRPPALFALYVSYYTFGRFFEELIRIDPAHHFFGLRLNAWVSAGVFVLSTAFFIWWQFLRGGEEEPGRPRRRVPEGPAMAIPRERVRPSR